MKTNSMFALFFLSVSFLYALMMTWYYFSYPTSPVTVSIRMFAIASVFLSIAGMILGQIRILKLKLSTLLFILVTLLYGVMLHRSSILARYDIYRYLGGDVSFLCEPVSNPNFMRFLEFIFPNILKIESACSGTPYLFFGWLHVSFLMCIAIIMIPLTVFVIDRMLGKHY